MTVAEEIIMVLTTGITEVINPKPGPGLFKERGYWF